MKDNGRLIIFIVGLMGIAALAGLIGLAYLEKPSVGDLGQIAFGVPDLLRRHGSREAETATERPDSRPSGPASKRPDTSHSSMRAEVIEEARVKLQASAVPTVTLEGVEYYVLPISNGGSIMLGRVIRALVVGILTTLGCLLAGIIILTIDVDLAQAVGGFLKTFAGAFGVLSALWFFFSGSTWPTRNI